MTGLKRLRVAAGLLALVGIGSLTAAPHALAASATVGHVYVNDNTAGGNTIAAFDRHADGSLTPTAGSPFAAGGAGTGAGIGSQGSLQLSSDGRYLLAADAGSNQISVLKIRPDGSLASAGAPVSSGGVKPVSIAVHGELVFVANAGAGGSNYTGFTLSAGGHLAPQPNTTFALSDSAVPGDVLFNSTGTNLIGTEVGTSLIDSFAVRPNGRLTPAAGSPFAAEGLGPFGSEFRPTDPTQLFVSNAHNGGSNLGTVSAFGVDAAGALTSRGGPYADFQNAPCWVEISHDGQYLFAVNTASSSISSYSIGSNGALTLVGSPTPFGGGVHGEEDARLDPSGTSLYVVDSGSDAVSGFAVSGATLVEYSSSPTALPAGAHPFGIVVN